MVNYSSNMRYSRMGNSYSQQRQNYGNMMAGRENCGCMQMVNNMQERQSEECPCKCMEDKCDNYYESECKEDLSTMPLAMAYVPWQKWCNIYEICKGFQRGTIFGELDKPFLGRGGCNR